MRVGALYVGNMMSGMLGNQQPARRADRRLRRPRGIEAIAIEAACASGGAAARDRLSRSRGRSARDRRRLRRRADDACRPRHRHARSRDRRGPGARRWRRGIVPVAQRAAHARLHDEVRGARRKTSRRLRSPPITTPSRTRTRCCARRSTSRAIWRRASCRIPCACSTPRRSATARPLSCSLRPRRQRRSADRRACASPASAAATAPLALARRRDPLKLDAVEASTNRALELARVVRTELDLFELHDAYTIMSVLTLESAGFAKPGTGASLAADGRLALDGDLPIATFGASRPAVIRSGRRAAISSSKRTCSSRAPGARIRCATPSSRSCRTSAAPAPPS